MTPKSTTLVSRPFEIFVPATENRAAKKVDTIQVQVYIDSDGDEVLTSESLALIDKTQARYMGLLLGEDILALRERLHLSQDEFSDLLGCGKKSLSRWENGHGYPSQLVNTLLRALDESFLTVAQLQGLQQPKVSASKPVPKSSFDWEGMESIYMMRRQSLFVTCPNSYHSEESEYECTELLSP